jgi:hypothetical protein
VELPAGGRGLPSGLPLLQKPFKPHNLALAVRECLDQRT